MDTTEQKKQRFIDAYTGRGTHKISPLNISEACLAAGVGRTTYYSWKDTDPEFVKELEEAELNQMKQVESFLFKRIEEGSDKLTEFYLKTKGKKLGYGEEKQDNNFIFKVTIQKEEEDTEDTDSDEE